MPARGGSDRVELIWADGAIQKTWLEVIVKGNDALGESNTNTGLDSSYVFYFGSALADSGAGNTGAFQTTSADEISARNNPTNLASPATRSNVNDFNRDGQVTSADQIIARNNTTSLGNQLKFLVVGAGGPFGPDSMGSDATAGGVSSVAAGPLAPSASPATGGDSSLSADDTIAFALGLSPNSSASAPSPTSAPMAGLPSTDAKNAADSMIDMQRAEDDAIDGPARFAGAGPMTDGLDLDDELLDLLVTGRLQASLS